MGRIYCIIGKSSTGKDSLYKSLLLEKSLSLKKIIPYTTRPIRAGEREGVEYYFCDEKKVAQLEKQGKIIELRAYNTMHGIWKYFTADDGQICLDTGDYLMIGTLESYGKIRSYYGNEHVVPIYIEVEDGERLNRALTRERMQKHPKYEEMCRRFLADAKDFSEEKLKDAGIEKRYENLDLETLKNTIKEEIHAWNVSTDDTM